MSLTAIVREVSPGINRCELSFHSRKPIDVNKAIAQHRAYQECLAGLEVRIVSLPAEPDLPDSVFVEDAAAVFDEVAVIPIMGAPSRRPETKSLAQSLSRHRPIKLLSEPATLDGGDVLQIGSRVFVGSTRRTNMHGINQLREILRPYGYSVEAVEINKCLHLKSACSYIGNNSILINRAFLDPKSFHGIDLIDVPIDEPAAANALTISDTVIIPVSFPKTRDLLESRDFRVQAIDLSELQKAEAGVTCCSAIFQGEP
jgi:dimethylargininase